MWTDIPLYKRLCLQLKWIKEYYRLTNSYDKDLFDYMFYLDSSIKEIDKSIPIQSDGGRGNYKPTKKKLFRWL